MEMEGPRWGLCHRCGHRGCELLESWAWVPTRLVPTGLGSEGPWLPCSLSVYAVYFIKVQQLGLGFTLRCLSVWGSAGVGFLCPGMW